jgi:hypothetical protein
MQIAARSAANSFEFKETESALSDAFIYFERISLARWRPWAKFTLAASA